MARTPGRVPDTRYLKILASLLKQLWLDEREMRATVSEDSVFSYICMCKHTLLCLKLHVGIGENVSIMQYVRLETVRAGEKDKQLCYRTKEQGRAERVIASSGTRTHTHVNTTACSCLNLIQ